ncbi:MAG TPA: restriction endonuclease [Thermoanaerobaculia bacterium]|nr:restriction endonuclease [Thermoanaerobaculia bacterium]
MAKAEQEGTQFVRFFGPLLDALRELGGSGAPSEVVEQIAADLGIPDDVQNELLDSGTPRFRNQVAWGRFYLMREGLIDSSKRGVWSLTDKGRVTHLSPAEARAIFQKWTKIFAEERKKKKGEPPVGDEEAPDKQAPIPVTFRERVSEILLALPPAGFERFCQRLLRESGFVQVVVSGRSGDGGIDGHGTLQVNPLVSFKVLFQCKRFKSSVTSALVRDFRGAMQGRADKGIIMTTGTFTADARKEATRDGVPPIELVDGQKVVDMLSELELGLKPVTAYEVDEDFFKEFA